MRLAAFGMVVVTIAAVPARAGGDVATQRLLDAMTLDAMTRHDLCARDDAQLRRLNRSLASAPGRRPTAARTR